MIEITNEERATYDWLLGQRLELIRQGLLDDSISNKPVWGNIRAESAALGTQSNIEFAVNEDNNSIPTSVTEQRLAKVDGFLATRIGIYIAKYTTATGRTSIRYKTNPNLTLFAAAGEAAALMGIYNAQLNITVNSDLIFGQMDTQQFYDIPQLPEGTGTTSIALVPASAVGVFQGGVNNEEINKEIGMLPLTPTLTLWGGKKNLFSIEMGAALALASAAGSTNIVILQLRGFQLKNWNSGKINLNYPG